MNLSGALSTLANGGASRKLKSRRVSMANAVAACVADVTPLPAADAVHFLIMDQKWAMADLIPVCHEFGGTIDALTVFTLGWSRQTVADMVRAKETGLLRHARVVASHFFRRTEKGVFNVTFPLLDAAGIPFVCVNSHIKAIAFHFSAAPRGHFHCQSPTFYLSEG